MQGLWRGAAYWLVHQLLYKIQDHLPKDGTTLKGWELPHQSLIKKIPYIWILRLHYLNEDILLSGSSSLCQVDRTRQSMDIGPHEAVTVRPQNTFGTVACLIVLGMRQFESHGDVEAVFTASPKVPVSILPAIAAY